MVRDRLPDRRRRAVTLRVPGSVLGHRGCGVSLARTLAPTIRVNGVAPGFIAGRWTEAGLGANYDRIKSAYEKTLPLGRVCEPEDVAAWPRTSREPDYKNQFKRWYHGDYRAKAYLYTYRLYDLFVTDGGLKN